ncbi:hypothetical protein CR513_56433, partial [Mucuna pruriens]
MKIGASLDPGVEEEVVCRHICIDPNEHVCYRLSISLGARLVSQKKRRLGEEKKREVRAETAKLLHARFI